MSAGPTEPKFNYSPEVVPFVTRILVKTYENGQFYGGRGAPVAQDSAFVYSNRYVGSFLNFSGTEYVYDTALQQLVGSCRIAGYSLLPLPWRQS
jgi:hypothetical protein